MAHSGPFSAPAPNGGSLFFGPNEPDTFGQPVQSSQHPPQTVSAVLTVADVLPQLPPELAKAAAVKSDQAIQISSALLHQALSTGQLAVPLFEVYRVCPAIFQSPVSPDDPRQIRLPASKLPALIAASQSIPGGADSSPRFAGPASPFGTAAFPPTQPAAPLSNPFQIAPPPSQPGLPPRRDPIFGGSPASDPSAPPPPVVSPFALQPQEAGQGAPVSPFPTTPHPLFGVKTEAPKTNDAPGPVSSPPIPPFGSPARPPTDSPFGTPQAAPAPPAFTPPTSAESPSRIGFGSPGKFTGGAVASVATLLQGHPPEALGFDPSMVPSWITTHLHGGIVSQLEEMTQPEMDLGTLVDGITDIGFRNVLQSARRGQLIPIPLSALQPDKNSSSAIPGAFSTEPQAAPQPPSTPAAAAPMKIEPGNPFAAVPEPAPALQSPGAMPAEPSPTADVGGSRKAFIQPNPEALFHFNAQPTGDPEVRSNPPPAPTQVTDPQAGFGKSHAVAMDPFAQALEHAPQRAISNGLSSFDLMGNPPTNESPPDALFPAAEVEAAPEPPETSGGRDPFLNRTPAMRTEPEREQSPLFSSPMPSPVLRQEDPAPSQLPLMNVKPTQNRPETRPSMGLSAFPTTSDEQLLLRALLGTDDVLTLDRVVQLTSELPGIAACALVCGEEVLASSAARTSDAKSFRTQAAELSRSLRTLAPLIGIEDAETFTLNTDSRLITFCFPGRTTIGVLHDREPTLGLRDKLTLIARQLEKMSAGR